MKKLLLFSLLIVSLVACKSKKDKTSDETTDMNTEMVEANTTYMVESGVINWKGSKLMGSSHNGTIAVSNGSIGMAGDNIASGTFTIDMSTITNVDMQGEDGQGKLEGHLKSADFFDVTNHPTAVFEIKNAMKVEGDANATHQLIGDLTIKGVTNAVTIPVKITKDGSSLKITSNPFNIDRTKWNVEYNSKKVIGNLKDKIINDNIELSVDITAKSAS